MKDLVAKTKILGARALAIVTGPVPDKVTWPMVWGGNARYSPQRWKERDAAFVRRGFEFSDALAYLEATGAAPHRTSAISGFAPRMCSPISPPWAPNSTLP